MKREIKLFAGAALLLSSLQVFAVPLIQLGAKDSNGNYLPYNDYTNPTEDDTAVTSGSPFSLDVAMAYKQDNIKKIGGQYLGLDPSTDPNGLNWSDFGYNSIFNTRGALLMVSAYGTGNISVGGLSAFYSTTTYEDGFVVPNPPSNHAPIQETGLTYLFFDIGNFLNKYNIPNFDPSDSDQTNALGEIKSLEVNISDFDWAHFDAFALVTTDDIICWDVNTDKKCNQNTTLSYNFSETDTGGNPGSHDVTWKNSNPPTPEPEPVPEPAIVWLLGAGLLCMTGFSRRNAKFTLNA